MQVCKGKHSDEEINMDTRRKALERRNINRSAVLHMLRIRKVLENGMGIRNRRKGKRKREGEREEPGIETQESNK